MIAHRPCKNSRLSLINIDGRTPAILLFAVAEQDSIAVPFFLCNEYRSSLFV